MSCYSELTLASKELIVIPVNTGGGVYCCVGRYTNHPVNTGVWVCCHDNRDPSDSVNMCVCCHDDRYTDDPVSLQPEFKVRWVYGICHMLRSYH